MEVVKINKNDLQVKEWNGQRVITFTDIDRVHERPEGTAHRNFKTNKKHLIENEDYYVLKPADILKDENRPLGFETEKPANRGTTYLTESGYLLLVKSFTDDLAWKVQRQLVNSYFKFKEVMETMQPNGNDLILSNAKFAEALDSLETCAAVFQSMMDYSTINYKQQQDLLQTARKRVNNLLGGALSKYARPVGSNNTSGGNEIIPLTENQARKWMEENCDTDAYIAEFGEVAE